ncbi:unnamed protein product [Adineta steineri]|nr:unnamed protein product [Adineta steineri]
MHRTYTASFSRFPFPFYNHDFSLEFCLSEKSLRVQCSHMGGLEAETHIKVPFHRWFHIVLSYSSVFIFYINGYAYPLICNAGPLCKQDMIKRTTDIDKNKYLILSHEGYPKFGIISRFADIQVLPYALTRCEIKAIVERKTCIGQLDMSRYLLEHWTSMHWYSKYLPNCILF